MKKPSTAQLTLRLYWQHLRKHQRLFWPIVVLTVAIIVIDDFLAPLIIANVFNKLNNLPPQPDLWSIFGLSLLVFGIEKIVVVNVFWRSIIWMLWTMEVAVKRELAGRSFDFLLHQSYRFHTNRFGGSLVSQTFKLINASERLTDVFVFNLLPLTTTFIATIVFLAPKAPWYVAIVVLLSIVYILLLHRQTSRLRPYNSAHAESESAQTGQLADVMANIQTAKTFAREDLEKKLFAKVTDTVANRDIAILRKQTVNDVSFSVLNNSVAWAALFFGVYLVIYRHAPTGLLFLMVSYTMNLLMRLWELSGVMRQINRGFGDANDMTLMMQEAPEITDAHGATQLQSVRGDIQIKDITFEYPETPGQPLFDGFSLHIKPGEKVGLVGHSGSGKTTLTKLLLRFMDISGGTIYIDGHDISTVTQQSLRAHIAYVSQEPIMFHRSISENIRYGELGASDQEVEAVAKMANAHEFIKHLPHTYDTLVGERGTKLSGGQRQRVAIARAMLKNAPILLLDEATSALDSESEALIQEALFKLMEGRTAIVIAHRLSTVQKMDRIIVLDHGRIVEQGTHKELLRANGTYAGLWNRQSGGFIDE
jgi:ATP-binding cassette subfamily B protein